MTLTSLETYYSFPNINTSNNHVKISFDEGNTWLDVYIPVGCYEIKASAFHHAENRRSESSRAHSPVTERCVARWRF